MKKKAPLALAQKRGRVRTRKLATPTVTALLLMSHPAILAGTSSLTVCWPLSVWPGKLVFLLKTLNPTISNLSQKLVKEFCLKMRNIFYVTPGEPDWHCHFSNSLLTIICLACQNCLLIHLLICPFKKDDIIIIVITLKMIIC